MTTDLDLILFSQLIQNSFRVNLDLRVSKAIPDYPARKEIADPLDQMDPKDPQEIRYFGIC
jgi:hypothetical protein